jgi:predicted porin
LALSVEGPYVGINFYNGDQATWIVNPSTNVAGVGGTTIGGGDDNRVYYITPAIAGFRAGASYASSSSENLQTQPLVTETDITDVALQWAGKVGDFGLRASTSYWWSEGSTSTASGSNRNFRFGGDVTFADFTVGAGWLRKSAKEGDASGGDATSWNVGAVYKPGPWSVGLTYANADAEATRAIEGEDEARRWVLGATYAIGPGVTAMTNVLYHRYNDEGNAVAGENKGIAVIGGIQLAF